jgi:transposase
VTDPDAIAAVLNPFQPQLRRAGHEAGSLSLAARTVTWKRYCRLHDLVVKFVARHELCRRFMAIRGVEPVTALSIVTALDDPSRFRRSRDVAAYFGLTSRRRRSGTAIDVQERISKAGDGDVRRALYEAASALTTRFKGRDKVRIRGLALAKRGCHREATVAMARKLAVIMHACGRTEPATSAMRRPSPANAKHAPP